MALSPLVFLGTALGTMALGAGAGVAKRKIQEDADNRKFTLQTMQKGLMDAISQGVVPPEDFVKEAMGGDAKRAKALMQVIGPIAQAHKMQRDKVNGYMDQTFGGAPQGAMGAEGGGEATPGPYGGALAALAGGQGVPGVDTGTGPMLPGAEPQPAGPGLASPPGAPNPLAPAGRTGMGSLLRPRPTLSMNEKGGMSISVAPPSDEAVRLDATAKLTARGFKAGWTPAEMKRQAANEGLTFTKDQMDSYSEDFASRTLPGMYAQATADGRPFTPEVKQQVQMNFFALTGYAPTELWKSLLASDPSTLKAWINRSAVAAAGSGYSFVKWRGGLADVGVPLNTEDEAQARSFFIQSAQQQLLTGPRGKDYEANPDALKYDVWKMTGLDKEAPAATAAPVAAGTGAATTELGQPPILTRELMPGAARQPSAIPGVRTGAPGAPGSAPQAQADVAAAAAAQQAAVTAPISPGGLAAQARERAEAQAAEQAGAVTEATGVGAARAEEKKKGIVTVSDPKKLAEYVDVKSKSVVAQSQTQAALDAKVSAGQYGILHVAPSVFADNSTFRDEARKLDEFVGKTTIFDLSPQKRMLLQAKVKGVTVAPGGYFHIPADVFQGLWAEGYTKKQMEDAAFYNSWKDIRGVSLLRSQGEKGQGVSAKMFERGIAAFPDLVNDNKLIAREKVRVINEVAQTLYDSSVSFVPGARPTPVPADAPFRIGDVVPRQGGGAYELRRAPDGSLVWKLQ